jgi:asparagine synthase (glutamine-hydrolysing)
MCGIVGIIQQKTRLGRDELITHLRNSGQAMAHRGPDDAQEWASDDGHAGFAFRRLSIRDLSSAGRQPMASHCGRYVMMFNGEIYNHLDIRNTLDAEISPSWIGHSDSETLVTAIAHWGLDATLVKLDGMFAIAVWDKTEKKLSLVRDRFGEKPLYYMQEGDTLYFASELKALPPLGANFGEIDREALAIYFRLRYIPATRSIYKNVKKLRPGKIIEFRCEASPALSSRFYWDSLNEALRANAKGFDGSREDALAELDQTLQNLVQGRLASDVPLGAFLSGGIDSSLVTALAQNQNSSAINTYTIAFEDKHFNEANEARRVADHLGTNHTELVATEHDTLNLVEKISSTYDEPFADPSQLPTMLLCQLARQHVTVALSGDGGDEFFAGYSRYPQILSDWGQKQKAAPLSGLTGAAASLPWSAIDGLVGMTRKRPARYGTKITNALMKSSAASLGEVAQHYSGFWRDGVPVKGISKTERNLFNGAWPMSQNQAGMLGNLKSLMTADSLVYLPDDLMVKVDRASMGASLEVRTPFLNQDLAKLCWSLPSEWHANQNGGLKCLLRETLYKYVPQDLVDRPKQGFDVPLRHWLRNDLKEWGGDLIASASSQSTDLLDLKRIKKRWEDHQKGANWEGDLWPALVYLGWVLSV